MNRIVLLAVLLFGAVCDSAVIIYDTNVVVQTFAGSGFTGLVNGVGVETMFNTPYAVAIDSQSNLFVGDFNNGCIRKIAPDATVTTFVTQGGGRLVIDRDDNIWFSNGNLATATPAGVVTSTNVGFPIDLLAGFACDSFNNIYFTYGERIWRFTTNRLLEVFAGSGNLGYQNGTGIFTAFNDPRGLAFDQANNLFVADSDNFVVRRITPNRVVTTYAGIPHDNNYVDGPITNASFEYVEGIAVDASGNVLVAGEWGIRRISPQGMVTTVAGAATPGYTNGPGESARFQGVVNFVVAPSGDIFVPDRADQRIRSITAPRTIQVSPSQLALRTYAGITITGIVGRTYRIESSTLQNTNWVSEGVFVLPSSPHLWIDNTSFVLRKFYRAFLLP